ncbi:MAG TPA: NADP-dependent oxidoreductase [Nitrospira sp.]|nr:NADP-dependent oxidoreductase [Nitrospira sp.]
MPPKNHRIVLAARPSGEPKDEDFRLEEAELPSPTNGQVVLRTLYLSLDPYMRGRMNAGPSYAPPVEIGQVMEADAVGEVLESKSIELKPGDLVVGHTRWQEFAVAEATNLRKLDPRVAPISTALGVLGMPGLTAYTGFLNLGQPKHGETVVVAAAAGAVGSIVGQIAKIKGCRAVGIAGGKAKCDYVVNELGFDACIDHHSNGLADALARACPKGIDIYFENVGGPVFDAVLPLMNPFGRIPVCGLIAHYNATNLPPGPNRVPLLMRAILTKRLSVRGFIVTDFRNERPQFEREMAQWLREGKMKYREDVVDRLENAIAAFKGLFHGHNVGKLLVRVAEPHRADASGLPK